MSHESVKAAVAAAIQQGGERGFKQKQLEQFVLEQHIGTWCFDEIQQAIAESLTDQTIAPQDAMPQQIIEPTVGNRSTPFGDVISRARQQRMLYATRAVDIAQPRNFSPPTFLKQVNADAQTSQTTIPLLDRPGFPRSVECSDRDCFEPASAVDAARVESTAAGDRSTAARDTAVEQQLAALARSLDEHLEPLAEAIADHHADSSASSSARESLQQQLQQLIKALSTWSSQLRQEVSLQQQLLDSMQQLEAKLDDWNAD